MSRVPAGVEEQRRRSLRRGVRLRCDVRSDFWDGTVHFSASNLSPDGIWLDTAVPLEQGEQLLVSFSPPRQFLRLHALCEVRRVGLWRRTTDPWTSGMGLSFVDLSAPERLRLARALIGIPPPLPRRRPDVRAGVNRGRAPARPGLPALPAVLDPAYAGQPPTS